MKLFYRQHKITNSVGIKCRVTRMQVDYSSSNLIFVAGGNLVSRVLRLLGQWVVVGKVLPQSLSCRPPTDQEFWRLWDCISPSNSKSTSICIVNCYMLSPSFTGLYNISYRTSWENLSRNIKTLIFIFHDHLLHSHDLYAKYNAMILLEEIRYWSLLGV